MILSVGLKNKGTSILSLRLYNPTMTTENLLTFDDTSVAFEAKSDRELKKTHFIFASMNNPLLVRVGTALTSLALKLKLPVKGLIRSTMFDQFCGGEAIDKCEKTIDHLGRYHVRTILDFSAEGQEDEASFDFTRDEALRVADFAKENPNIAFCVVKLTGLGSRELMARVQEGKTLKPGEAARFEAFKARVEAIAKRAYDNGLRFMIDAEESWIQDVIDGIAYDLMRKFNRERPVVYITYQFYRHDALEKMKQGYADLTAEGCFFAAKLVRGAYMEKERERAEEKGYRDPIQADKAATDRDYNLAQEFILDHIDRFSVCSGTHNEMSCALLAGLMEAKGLKRNDERVYFSQLLGMSDNISFNLAKEGYNVSKYVPYGPVEKVLPYLFRRAEENSAIKGQSGREFILIKKEIERRKANK